MGLRIKSAQNGATPLRIVHALLNGCGYGTVEEKATVANQLLGTDINAIEELTDEQLALLAHKVAGALYA